MSRLFVFLIPLVVIAIFWAMSRYEAKRRHDPTRKGFFERNGTVLGIVFIALVAFWTLFLVVLPYLYMVQESFHPKLPPLKRGGPEDFLTLEQYRSFFVEPSSGDWNATHMGAFLFSIVASVAVTALQLRHLLSARLLHGAGRHRPEGAPADARPDRALLGERDPARLRPARCCSPPRA